MGLTILDFADYELLQVINQEPKGTTADLAERLDLGKRDVSSRLSWMKRMGLTEKTIAENWIVTRIGRDMLDGKAPDILDTREIAKRAKRSGAMGWVVKREIRRELGR